jgi:hypothetical protein
MWIIFDGFSLALKVSFSVYHPGFASGLAAKEKAHIWF